MVRARSWAVGTAAGLNPGRQCQSPAGKVSGNTPQFVYDGSRAKCTLILLNRFQTFQKSSMRVLLSSSRATFCSPTSSMISRVFFSSSASREENQSSPLAFFAAMAKTLLSFAPNEMSRYIGIVSEQTRGRNDAVLSAKRPETSPSRSCLLDQLAGSSPFVGALRDGESVSSRDGDHRVEGSEGLGIIGRLELEP